MGTELAIKDVGYSAASAGTAEGQVILLRCLPHISDLDWTYKKDIFICAKYVKQQFKLHLSGIVTYLALNLHSHILWYNLNGVFFNIILYFAATLKVKT
jgi:hypothetical protein